MSTNVTQIGPESFVDDRWLARRINASRALVCKKRREGTGPRFHKIGRLVRYKVADIEAWLAQQVVEPKHGGQITNRHRGGGSLSNERP